jgi:hypothetical protein
MELWRNAGTEIPDCAIVRRFAPIRWLHPGYRALGVQTCE